MRTIYFVKKQEKAIWTVCQEAAGSKSGVYRSDSSRTDRDQKGRPVRLQIKLLARKTIELEVNYLGNAQRRIP